MALFVGGTAVMSRRDFIALTRELPEDFKEPVLTALFLGMPVDRGELQRVLNVRVRLAASSDKADDIIDRALGALELQDDSIP